MQRRTGVKRTTFRGTNGTRARARGAIAKAHARTARRAAPGFTRTSGFFGRFTGANAELKFHDIDIDDATVAAGGTIAEDSCNGIAQGVTESERIGRKCTIRNIGWRFELVLPALNQTNGNPDTVRVILYLDQQTNGAPATVAGILESDDFQSFNNLANKGRFKILMDRVYTQAHTAGAYDGTGTDFGGNIINDTYFKKVNIPIEFDSTTGAITEVRSNNLGVLLVGRSGLMQFSSKMRLRFSDL